MSEKAFDATVVFHVMNGWHQKILWLRKNCGAEEALDFYEAIANYSLSDGSISPAFAEGSILELTWLNMEEAIDASLNNRKKNYGVKDDQRKIILDAFEQAFSTDSTRKWTQRELAELAGLSKTTFNAWKNSTVTDEEINGIRARYVTASSASANDYALQDAEPTFGSAAESAADSPSPSGCTLCPTPTYTTGQDNGTKDSSEEKNGNTDTKAPGIRRYRSIDDDFIIRIPYESRTRCKRSLRSLMEEYLDAYPEPTWLKRAGDKYGRAIIGFDEERDKPIVRYALYAVPNWLHRHDISPLWLDMEGVSWITRSREIRFEESLRKQEEERTARKERAKMIAAMTQEEVLQYADSFSTEEEKYAVLNDWYCGKKALSEEKVKQNADLADNSY